MRFTLAQIAKSTARIVSITEVKPLAIPMATARKGRRKAGSPTPHDILWAAIEQRWPGAAQREYSDAVPNRKFRIDIAFPRERLALEVDGWQHHGRFLSDFIRDRERQNLLCINGWRVLRFSAGMIRQSLQRQLGIIDQALRSTGIEPRSPVVRKPLGIRHRPPRGDT